MVENTSVEKGKKHLRIIAGTYRGRILHSPKGMDTRPTQGRVRESLFSILQHDIPRAYVLDLFAGSGALGLESLSRGAGAVVFVDSDRHAQAAIEKNIQLLLVTDQCRLFRCDYLEAIARLKNEARQFDLLFLDPPYRFSEIASMLSIIASSGILSTHALVVYEHDKKYPVSCDVFVVIDERTYGDTVITFMKRKWENP